MISVECSTSRRIAAAHKALIIYPFTYDQGSNTAPTLAINNAARQLIRAGKDVSTLDFRFEDCVQKHARQIWGADLICFVGHAPDIFHSSERTPRRPNLISEILDAVAPTTTVVGAGTKLGPALGLLGNKLTVIFPGLPRIQPT